MKISDISPNAMTVFCIKSVERGLYQVDQFYGLVLWILFITLGLPFS